MAASDADADSLLDIFKNEEVEDSPLKLLCSFLDDVNVYSLLDDSIQIADSIRWRRGE